MTKKIKVIQYGIGPIGLKVTNYLLERNNIEIVGAVDIDPAKFGVDLGKISGAGKELEIRITNNAKELFESIEADVVVLTTTSSLEKIYPQIIEILEHGLHIVSTCEELTYPWITNPELSHEIDRLAKEKNAAILSTGVNPGFLMDFLPAALTAICKEVNKVTVERLQDAQFRRIPFQQKIGAGLSLTEFQKKIEDGSLRHVGLTESVHLIASKLGWELDKTEDIIEPVIAEKEIKTDSLTIKAGDALGVQQIGRGEKDGKELIRLVFRASIGEPNPRDRIIIDGVPRIDSTIKDGMNGDIATCAITVNAISSIVKAKPGLRTMADIEPVSCFR